MMIFRGVSRCNYAAAIAAMNTANCVEHGPTSEASSTPNFSKKHFPNFIEPDVPFAMFTRSVHLSLSSHRLIHSVQ